MVNSDLIYLMGTVQHVWISSYSFCLSHLIVSVDCVLLTKTGTCENCEVSYLSCLHMSIVD